MGVGVAFKRLAPTSSSCPGGDGGGESPPLLLTVSSTGMQSGLELPTNWLALVLNLCPTFLLRFLLIRGNTEQMQELYYPPCPVFKSARNLSLASFLDMSEKVVIFFHKIPIAKLGRFDCVPFAHFPNLDFLARPRASSTYICKSRLSRILCPLHKIWRAISKTRRIFEPNPNFGRRSVYLMLPLSTFAVVIINYERKCRTFWQSWTRRKSNEEMHKQLLHCCHIALMS